MASSRSRSRKKKGPKGKKKKKTRGKLRKFNLDLFGKLERVIPERLYWVLRTALLKLIKSRFDFVDKETDLRF